MATAPTIDLGTKQIMNGGGVNPVAFGYYPQEGSRACNLAYNWSVNLAYREDLTEPLKALGMITTAQSVFIDNSLNPGAVTLQVDGTQQVLVVPPYSQAMLPILFGENAAYWISTTVNNNIATKVIVLNVPCVAGVWLAQPANIANNGSGIASTPLLGTQAFPFFSGSSGNVMPAVAGKRWYISAVQATVRNNSTLTGGGEIEIQLEDGAGNLVLQAAGLVIPAAAATTTQNIPIFNLSGLNYISGVVNTTLNLIITPSFTTGGVDITVFGGYTTQTP